MKVKSDRIWISEHFSVDFQRTPRIPDDGNVYPLPPGLGRLPVRRVDDYLNRVPTAWREHDGVFIPMYQREALWLCFGGSYWKPHAVKIAVGKINVVTGRGWAQPLEDSPVWCTGRSPGKIRLPRPSRRELTPSITCPGSHSMTSTSRTCRPRTSSKG